MENLKHARIVLIVMEEISVTKLNQFMDKEAATIWVQVGGNKAKNTVRIGGIYRQHHLLGQGEMDEDVMEVQRAQERRWGRIVEQWKEAGRRHNTVVLGDLNLDQGRWHNPEPQHADMVELIQEEIETSGYEQLITNTTRAGKGQRDSVIDHIWDLTPWIELVTMSTWIELNLTTT